MWKVSSCELARRGKVNSGHELERMWKISSGELVKWEKLVLVTSQNAECCFL
jgi:hypothetical protein